MAKHRAQHVVPRPEGWAVRGAGNAKDTKVYRTQKAAIEAGRVIAKNQSSELVIHRRNGRIREKNSYGRDPHPPNRLLKNPG